MIPLTRSRRGAGCHFRGRAHPLEGRLIRTTLVDVRRLSIAGYEKVCLVLSATITTQVFPSCRPWVPSPRVGEGQGEGAVGRAPAEHPLFLTFPHTGGRDPYCGRAELGVYLWRIALSAANGRNQRRV
jgi:hypothetical protein